MKKALLALTLCLVAITSHAETNEQIVSRLHLKTYNYRFEVGGHGNCLLPGINNVNPACIEPLEQSLNLILSLQDENSQIETFSCDAKAAGQFLDIVCAMNRFGTQDAKGCPYQRAVYEVITDSNAGAKLVSSKPYVYFCDGGEYADPAR